MRELTYPPATADKATGMRHLRERARKYRKSIAALRRRMGDDPRDRRRLARMIEVMTRWLADHNV